MLNSRLTSYQQQMALVRLQYNHSLWRRNLCFTEAVCSGKLSLSSNKSWTTSPPLGVLTLAQLISLQTFTRDLSFSCNSMTPQVFLVVCLHSTYTMEISAPSPLFLRNPGETNQSDVLLDTVPIVDKGLPVDMLHLIHHTEPPDSVAADRSCDRKLSCGPPGP